MKTVTSPAKLIVVFCYCHHRQETPYYVFVKLRKRNGIPFAANTLQVT